MAPKVVLDAGSREAEIIEKVYLAVVMAGGRWANRSKLDVENQQREMNRFGLGEGVDELQAAFLREIPEVQTAYGQFLAAFVAIVAVSVRVSEEKTPAPYKALVNGIANRSKEMSESLSKLRTDDTSDLWQKLAAGVDSFHASVRRALDAGAKPLPLQSGWRAAFGRWNYGERVAAPADMVPAMQETLAELEKIQAALRPVIAEMGKN